MQGPGCPCFGLCLAQMKMRIALALTPRVTILTSSQWLNSQFCSWTHSAQNKVSISQSLLFLHRFPGICPFLFLVSPFTLGFTFPDPQGTKIASQLAFHFLPLPQQMTRNLQVRAGANCQGIPAICGQTNFQKYCFVQGTPCSESSSSSPKLRVL